MGAILASLVGSVLLLSPVGHTDTFDDVSFGGPELMQPGVVVSADAADLPDVDAKAWLVADADTGDVLAARNAHEALPPASTLKLLTAITLIGGLDPDLAYEATDADANVEGSRVGLAPDETYTFDDLTHGLMLASGNDAAYAIAELSGGQEEAIAAMNTEARRLGAVDTVALTPHGLDEPGQVSSAYDLALIARAALGDPVLAGLMGTTAYDFPGLDGTTFQIQNQNRLLGSYDGALGLKTGFTTEAGHTIAAAAERDDVRLIVTVLDPADGRAEPVAEALLDWGFAVSSTAEPVGTLVTPEEVEQHEKAAAAEADVDPSPTAENPAASDAAARPPAGPRLADVAMAGAGALAFFILITLFRRRRRRASGRYAA